ncbi:MAG: hypothetical protein ACRDSJ_12815 [Rubrobacteraceae bacterium]
MIRKQLYISEDHDRALKLKAREMGISEAELVRRLLDEGLMKEDGARLPGRVKAGLEFLKGMERISREHSFPEDYKFDREEIHEEIHNRR